MVTRKQEAQWVLRAQCGDREALESLLRSAQPCLYRYLTRLVGAGAAEDALQETLILVVRKLKWLEEPELFRAWAYRVASRLAFRHLKRERRWSEQVRDQAVLEEIAAPVAPDSTGLALELLASEALSPSSRAVVALHFQEGLTLPEIAAVLEIPLGTVKSRLAYGLAALRRTLDPRSV